MRKNTLACGMVSTVSDMLWKDLFRLADQMAEDSGRSIRVWILLPTGESWSGHAASPARRREE